jgi:hypothetical protein
MMSFPKTFDRLKVVVMALAPRARRAALEQVIAWAEWERDLAEDEAELDRELDRELAPASGRQVVAGSEWRHGEMTIRREKVKCGKPSCRTCPHGPYFYGYLREGGRMKSVYLGKNLSPELQAVYAERQQREPHEDAPG